ncbi:hypothetical protein ACFQJ7_03625 [Halovenus rubra]|uniref:Uncharacterized protein n=2 Tax=Halovenus rubra TaxID=869890 RepID=A0ACC7DXV2_9EURY|nr:hypothetical protein [Halovenus rubra]
MTNLFINYNWGSTEAYHDVTCELLNRASVDKVGATVVGRRAYKFLKQQDEVNYDPLYCVQDLHNTITEQQATSVKLAELEDRYGVPNLWPALLADRKYTEYPPKKQKALLRGWFDFFIKTFERFEPDVYMTSDVDSAYTWIPFRIVTEDYGTAVQKGHTRVLDRKGLQKTVSDQFEAIWNRYNQIESNAGKKYPDSHEKATTFLNKFRTEGLTPGYTGGDSSPEKESSKLQEAVEYWYEKNFRYYKNDFYHGTTRNRIKVSLKRLFWRKYIKKKSLFKKPNYDKKYVYFPLHLQPEASTMVKAPMYVELPDVIRNISKSLPINHRLYVKEHPALYNYKTRNPKYYKEISDLPNTTLIHPNVDSHELIKQSTAVTTVTGTAGLEGALYKKPVVTFGEPHYSILPQIYQAGDPKRLSDILQSAISEYVHTDKYESELIAYLTAIFKESYPTPSNKHGDRLDDAIQKQCEILQKDVLG